MRDEYDFSQGKHINFYCFGRGSDNVPNCFCRHVFLSKFAPPDLTAYVSHATQKEKNEHSESA